MSQRLFVKCRVLDREEGRRKKGKKKDNGRMESSRNGYHKVKCQVPETEELEGREDESVIKDRKKRENRREEEDEEQVQFHRLDLFL